jgi:hypothetical protein
MQSLAAHAQPRFLVLLALLLLLLLLLLLPVGCSGDKGREFGEARRSTHPSRGSAFSNSTVRQASRGRRGDARYSTSRDSNLRGDSVITQASHALLQRGPVVSSSRSRRQILQHGKQRIPQRHQRQQRQQQHEPNKWQYERISTDEPTRNRRTRDCNANHVRLVSSKTYSKDLALDLDDTPNLYNDIYNLLAEPPQKRQPLFTYLRGLGVLNIGMPMMHHHSNTTLDSVTANANRPSNPHSTSNPFVDMDTLQRHASPSITAHSFIHNNNNHHSPYTDETAWLSLSVDPISLTHLLVKLVKGTGLLAAAIGATLQWLTPMIVAQRVLYYAGTIGFDWYTGRYLRTTYARMEKQYWKFYQVPAAMRSVGRVVAQFVLLSVLGKIMEWMVGTRHPPCQFHHSSNLLPSTQLSSSSPLSSLSRARSGRSFGGCHGWCGFLWILAVVGTGHAASTALAVWWGGPLRLQVEDSYAMVQRPTPRKVFRPWHLLQWMRDPDQWIRKIARVRFSGPGLKPIYPDPRLFPVTWDVLKGIQYFAISKEMYHNKAVMHAIMRQVLFQQTMIDEWYRTLMCEKRVALAFVWITLYFLATFRLYCTVVVHSKLSAVLVSLSLLAILISAWMNVIVYFQRREAVGKNNASGNSSNNNNSTIAAIALPSLVWNA